MPDRIEWGDQDCVDRDSVCGPQHARGAARMKHANGTEDDTMETARAWIHHHDYFAIVVLLMLGSVGPPIPDEPVLTCVASLSFKGDLSVPSQGGSARKRIDA